MKLWDKEYLLKTTGEKLRLTFKGKLILETLKNQEKPEIDIFQALKVNNC